MSTCKKTCLLHLTNTSRNIGYIICEADLRFRILFTFLKKYQSKKIIVFFSSCACVKYYSELLNYIDLPVLDLHGKQKQQKRTNTFFEFCNAAKGTLICTDVAARGLDIPAVDWIVQFDPPDDPRDYIHRVGRTARGADGKGKSLMFLQPCEVGFLEHLKKARVPLVELEIPKKKVVDIQSQLEQLIGKNYYINKVSRTHSYPLSDHCTTCDANLLFLSVRERRLPLLPTSLRFAFAAKCVQRAQPGSSQGWKEFRIRNAAKS